MVTNRNPYTPPSDVLEKVVQVAAEVTGNVIDEDDLEKFSFPDRLTKFKVETDCTVNDSHTSPKSFDLFYIVCF